MVEFKLKDGRLINYDEDRNEIRVNGKLNKDWHPSFIPNGDDEPVLFGFVNLREGKCYDLYGGITNIVEEDSIKI